MCPSRSIDSIDAMSDPTLYINLPGTAREALTFYGDVFGCDVELHTFAEFQRTDGPEDALAHGELKNGPIGVFASDVAGGEEAFAAAGMVFALLGTARAAELREWFARLADGGAVLDDL